MAISFLTISPENGETNVPLNTEIVFRMIKDVGSINLDSLNIIINNGILSKEPIIDGVFSNNFSGEYIDNSILGDLSDVTVVIIRPSDDPEYQQGQKIMVYISVDSV